MKKLISILLCLLCLSACFRTDYIGEINVFIPGEYINEDVVSQFEYETGIRVNINTFGSNEEMFTKLLGGTVYDIVVPSDYMIEKLIQEKMLYKLDKSLIPNLEYLVEGVRNMDYDPDNTYSVPYFWGNVGIVYDERKIDGADVEKEGWAVLQNTKYKGLIYMYDSERDAFMMALKSLGYSMNTTNEEELEKAYIWLKQISETMEPAFVTDEAIDGLAYPEETDKKYMGMMYSGDAAYILSENEYAHFYAPDEGTNYFVDAMCIHKDAPHPDWAAQFMNFMLEYDWAYENSAYVGYSSCNYEALNDITLPDGDFEDNDAYIPRDKTDLDETFHNNDNVRKIIADYWVRVKNS